MKEGEVKRETTIAAGVLHTLDHPWHPGRGNPEKQGRGEMKREKKWRSDEIGEEREEERGAGVFFRSQAATDLADTGSP